MDVDEKPGKIDLSGKIIVVTGGAQGLGLAIAKTLASQGAVLALVDLNQSKLDCAVSGCEEQGGRAHAYIANVADEQEVISLFDRVSADLGPVYGLVNNAGILRDGLVVKAQDGKVVKKMSLAEWQSVIDVNLTGVFLCTREASEKMIEAGRGGVIINLCSVSQAGNMGQANYSAAKAGVAAMTVTCAKELARYGIRCMGIAPGFIGTDMVASMKKEALEKMTRQIPLGRLGEPEEIAVTAEFIFRNEYLTGRVIEADGGIRL